MEWVTDARKLHRPVRGGILDQIAKAHQLNRRRRHLQRKESLAQRRLEIIKSGSVKGFGGPCACGRNHRALKVDGHEECPIRLYLTIVRLRNEPRFAKWLERAKLERGEWEDDYLLSPLDPEQDCTEDTGLAERFTSDGKDCQKVTQGRT